MGQFPAIAMVVGTFMFVGGGGVYCRIQGPILQTVHELFIEILWKLILL